MRRSRAAVSGVVCALFFSGGTFVGCRSSQEDTPRAQESVAQKQKSEQPPAMKLLEKTASKRPSNAGAKPEMDSSASAAMGSPGGDAPMEQKAPSGKANRSAPSGASMAPQSGSGAAILGGLGSSGRGSGGLGLSGKGSGGGGAAYGQGSIGLRGVGSGMGASAPRMSVQGIGSASASGSGLMGKKSVVIGAPAYRQAPQPDPVTSTEQYADSGINPFVSTAEDHLSTFAIDVDTGSYTLARRKIHEGQLPTQEGVRVEEFLNYFRYSYPAPTDGSPLAVSMDAAPSPFNKDRHLLRVGVQGKQLSISERKSAHLTFLVDVSGSMQSPDRLPLAKRSLRMLVDNLRDGDTVALVTYAGNVKLALPPTGMEKKALIHEAIEQLNAGGSTAMASGIDLAYQQAMKTLDEQSVSRVIILSDGDANVGATSHQEILKQIRGYVKEGITVTTVGFGMGNYKDETMEQFANQGNGNHYYVDSLMAARKIFQQQLGGTLEVIAQDVKLQVDFDPAQVERYRLVGYENRAIADVHFRDDKIDAGELGSGHTVTALYELELKPGAGEGLATVRVRAKKPRGEKAAERAFRFDGSRLAPVFNMAKEDLRFAAAVMGAAELLRRSPHARSWNFDQVRKIARDATPAGNSEREEFLELLDLAQPLIGRVAAR
jgi:Ca-activated chloride channel family protein